MNPMEFLIVVAAIFLLVVVPILAIVAIVRVSSLTRTVGEIPKLINRIYELERRLESLSQRITAVTGGEARPATSAPAPNPSAPKPQPADMAASRVPAVEIHEPARPMAPARPAPTAMPVPHTPASMQSAAPLRPPLTQIPAPAHHHIEDRDVESTIAGRWFNYVGILAVAVAVSFFLKYAFDNNWIGPVGRITIGLIAGAALYPVSHWIFKRGYTYYAEGITGLGAAILYLSIWAGWHYYQIFSQGLAFPLMIVVTCLTVAVALGRNSERIAALALVGGLLTPILVSTGENAEVALFSYLIALGGGMLAIAWMRKWRSIAPIVFAGTLIYFWGWYSDFYLARELTATLLFATTFFVLFAALPAARSLRDGELSALEIGVVVTNVFSYLVALRLMLWAEYRWGLTFAVLALAAAHLFAGRALPRKNSASNRIARMLYDGLALTFATLAIPIRLEGKWITIAFAAEGLVLIWSGLRARSLALRAAGLVLFALVALRLGIVVFTAQTTSTFLLNERFLTLAVCAACWVAAFFLARTSDCQLDEPETHFFFFLQIAANFVFLIALSMDVWDLFGRMPSLGIDREHAQQLALSLLWVAYALVLLVAGVIRKSAPLRWQGLALLGLAIGKAFFFDLSFLTTFYRIVSFFVLGLVLLAVSFFYQKRSKTRLKPSHP
ncbi:MAG: DUF2339 domain-containing protein [Candidatus Acidiferrales bacterium]